MARAPRLFGFIRCDKCHHWRRPFYSEMFGPDDYYCTPCRLEVIENGRQLADSIEAAFRELNNAVERYLKTCKGGR